jgi:hypothetical protein
LSKFGMGDLHDKFSLRGSLAFICFIVFCIARRRPCRGANRSLRSHHNQRVERTPPHPKRVLEEMICGP